MEGGNEADAMLMYLILKKIMLLNKKYEPSGWLHIFMQTSFVLKISSIPVTTADLDLII